MANIIPTPGASRLERMPAGRIHEAINLGALGLLSASYVYEQNHLGVSEPAAFGFAAAYLIGTFLVTPDLDLAEQRVRAKGNWGVLGWLWVPYGLIFSHRGWSHTWIVGPLTRLVYMVLMGALLWFGGEALLHYLGAQLDLRGQVRLPPEQVLYSAAAGYFASQWMHLLADGIWPDVGFRRARR
jgi:uncharacterized metal-binding protein